MKKQKIILFILILCSLLLFLFLVISMYSQNTSTHTDKEPLASVELQTEESASSETISIEPSSFVEETQSSASLENASIPFEEPTTSYSEPDTTCSETISPDRITYMPDFYYEPLSDEIIGRIYGISYKTDCPVPYEELRYVHILHINFENEVTEGELICNRDIAQDMVEIFYELFLQNYQIERVKLVDEYQADDKLSMIDNNTSCFNYRTVEGTNSISKHGLGLAIDINPFYNPYVTKNNDGTNYVSPPGSEIYVDRTQDFPHKITENDLCYQLFTEHGFLWGGHWKYTKDYQHFYKEP